MEKPIAIFYHTYLVNNWIEVLTDQLMKLSYSTDILSKSPKLFITINGLNTDDINKAKDMISSFFRYCVNVQLYLDTVQNVDESYTLSKIYNFCRDNDYYILYFHMKGVNRVTQTSTLCRLHADFNVVVDYKPHLMSLRSFDTSGINLRQHTWIGTYPHYSNNYWWARSSYILTLNNTYLFQPNRYLAEFWIGSGKYTNIPLRMYSTNSFYKDSMEDMNDSDFIKSLYGQSKDVSYYITL